MCCFSSVKEDAYLLTNYASTSRKCYYMIMNNASVNMCSISCTKQYRDFLRQASAFAGSLSNHSFDELWIFWRGCFNTSTHPKGYSGIQGVYDLWIARGMNVNICSYQFTHLTYTYYTHYTHLQFTHMYVHTHTHTHCTHCTHLHTHCTHLQTHTTHIHTHTHHYTHTHTHVGASFAGGDTVPTVQQQEESRLHSHSSVIHLCLVLCQPLQQAGGQNTPVHQSARLASGEETWEQAQCHIGAGMNWTCCCFSNGSASSFAVIWSSYIPDINVIVLGSLLCHFT